MHPCKRAQRRLGRSAATVAALTFSVVLTLSVAALAANPKAGKKYAGFTAEPKIEGFGAPVSFKVSANGAKLLNFQYGSLGCFGAGGFRPGVNPFTQFGGIKRLGTVTVSKNGHFSITNAKSTYNSAKFKFSIVTTSQVTGQFVTSKRATGTIRFTQADHQGSKTTNCGPASIAFTASAH
jgi:hypothetical protein